MPPPRSRPRLSLVSQLFQNPQSRQYASLHSPDIELAEAKRSEDTLASRRQTVAPSRPLFPFLPASLIPRQKEHKHHHFSRCDVFVTTLVLAALALVVVAFALSESNPAVMFIETAASCTACATALAPLKVLAHAGDDAFTGVIVEFCIGSAASRPFLARYSQQLANNPFLRSPSQMADPDVCRGAIGSQAPILAHSLRSLSVHSPGATRLCTNVFGLCPITAVVPHKVDLPPEPQAVPSKEFARRSKLGETGLRRKWEDEAHDGDTFQVVQISDVHIDKEYLVRSAFLLVAPRRFAEADPDFRSSPSTGGRLGRLYEANLLSRLRPFVDWAGRQDTCRAGTQFAVSILPSNANLGARGSLATANATHLKLSWTTSSQLSSSACFAPDSRVPSLTLRVQDRPESVFHRL